MTPLFDPNVDINPAWWVLACLPVALLVVLVVKLYGAPAQPRSRSWLLWACRLGALAVFVAIALNPVHVAVTPAPAHRPEVHILLDASQSMKLGSPSRWQEATTLLRDAIQQQAGHADVRVYRFGERLTPVELAAFGPGGELAPPNDADTHLSSAFRQLQGRFGREAPAAVVVMSDGRVRDAEKFSEMASVWQRLHTPVHVVPVGKAAEGGDVAIVAAVAPARASCGKQRR